MSAHLSVSQIRAQHGHESRENARGCLFLRCALAKSTIQSYWSVLVAHWRVGDARCTRYTVIATALFFIVDIKNSLSDLRDVRLAWCVITQVSKRFQTNHIILHIIIFKYQCLASYYALFNVHYLIHWATIDSGCWYRHSDAPSDDALVLLDSVKHTVRLLDVLYSVTNSLQVSTAGFTISISDSPWFDHCMYGRGLSVNQIHVMIHYIMLSHSRSSCMWERLEPCFTSMINATSLLISDVLTTRSII